MLKTFKGGVYPLTYKTLTCTKNILIMPPPKVVKIDIDNRECVVKVGDEVKKGSLIAKANQNEYNIFCSISGRVKSTQNQTVTVENNFLNQDEHLKPLINPTSEQIVSRLIECGVCGLGGGGFLTGLKLQTSSAIEYLLINGAECEPYITCDHRIMLEYTQKFINGAILLSQAVNAKKIIIGIESNKQDAVTTINDYINQNNLNNIEVVVLKAKYPQGSDKQLIQSLTGKKIPKGQRSNQQGVLVFNVHTALNAYLAIKEGKQNYSRVTTISGLGIKNPQNLWIAIGTPYNDIAEFCNGFSSTPTLKIINGGTMMGENATLNHCTNILTASILFLTQDECNLQKPSPCINCKKCASACPMRLMPMHIDSLSIAGQYAQTIKYGLNYCIECGCCSFICPAKRDLLSSIKKAKQNLREGQTE